MEQQAYQLLEESESLDREIDWTFVEKMERDIELEIERLTK